MAEQGDIRPVLRLSSISIKTRIETPAHIIRRGAFISLSSISIKTRIETIFRKREADSHAVFKFYIH